MGDQPAFGYMNKYEWTGKEYQPRRALEKETLPAEPHVFTDEFTPDEWREILLECMRSDEPPDAQNDELAQVMIQESTAAMCDGINTGFYINAYTTKQLPDMQGTLEELRKGIERLELKREEAKEAAKQAPTADAQGVAAGTAPKRGPNKFGQALQTLNAMSSAFKRCHHRSMSETLMPIMFNTMTYFSHRCWKVFIKRAIFLAAQTWRAKFGQSVRHSFIKDGGGIALRYMIKDKELYPLVGWQRVCLDNGAELYRHPDGTERGDLQSAYDYDVAVKSKSASGSSKDERKVALTSLQRFLNEAEAETTQDMDRQGTRRVRTTTPVDDWLHRGDHQVLKDMPLYVYAMWVYSAEKPPFQGRSLGREGRGRAGGEEPAWVNGMAEAARERGGQKEGGEGTEEEEGKRRREEEGQRRRRGRKTGGETEGESRSRESRLRCPHALPRQREAAQGLGVRVRPELHSRQHASPAADDRAPSAYVRWVPNAHTRAGLGNCGHVQAIASAPFGYSVPRRS